MYWNRKEKLEMDNLWSQLITPTPLEVLLDKQVSSLESALEDLDIQISVFQLSYFSINESQ